MEAVLGHWALRARDGADSAKLAAAAARYAAGAGASGDVERAQAWVPVHAVTYLAYLLEAGCDLPAGVPALLDALR